MALTLFAAAAGVLVRDIGAATAATMNATLDPLEALESRFYAYELTYDLAVFSTVQVGISIEAMFSDWRLAFESNGSLVISFRPALPGIHRVLVTNMEDTQGQVGVSVLQLAKSPPELETSLLNPALLSATVLLVSSVLLFSLGRRGASLEGH